MAIPECQHEGHNYCVHCGLPQIDPRFEELFHANRLSFVTNTDRTPSEFSRALVNKKFADKNKFLVGPPLLPYRQANPADVSRTMVAIYEIDCPTKFRDLVNIANGCVYSSEAHYDDVDRDWDIEQSMERDREEYEDETG